MVIYITQTPLKHWQAWSINHVSRIPVSGELVTVSWPQGEELSTSLSPSHPQEAVREHRVTLSLLFSKPDKSRAHSCSSWDILPALSLALLPTLGCIQGPSHPSSVVSPSLVPKAEKSRIISFSWLVVLGLVHPRMGLGLTPGSWRGAAQPAPSNPSLQGWS